MNSRNSQKNNKIEKKEIVETIDNTNLTLARNICYPSFIEAKHMLAPHNFTGSCWMFVCTDLEIAEH